MAEWLIKKITGDDLIDKAIDLAIAEETARQIQAVKDEPIILKEEGSPSGTGAAQYWQSKRYEAENITVNGSRTFFDVSGIGKVVDIFVNHATSTSFSVELIVDGETWYSDSYANLAQTSIADSHLAVYKDEDTTEYFVKFSDINFIQGVKVLVSANGLTFDMVRANYEMLVQVQ